MKVSWTLFAGNTAYKLNKKCLGTPLWGYIVIILATVLLLISLPLRSSTASQNIVPKTKLQISQVVKKTVIKDDVTVEAKAIVTRTPAVGLHAPKTTTVEKTPIPQKPTTEFTPAPVIVPLEFTLRNSSLSGWTIATNLSLSLDISFNPNYNARLPVVVTFKAPDGFSCAPIMILPYTTEQTAEFSCNLPDNITLGHKYIGMTATSGNTASTATFDLNITSPTAPK